MPQRYYDYYGSVKNKEQWCEVHAGYVVTFKSKDPFGILGGTEIGRIALDSDTVISEEHSSGADRKGWVKLVRNGAEHTFYAFENADSLARDIKLNLGG